MRTITFTITALFFLTFSWAQTEIDEITLKLVDIFENTKAIKELAHNKKLVLGQLEDIKVWSDRGIPVAQTEKLEQAYNAYADIMNGIIHDMGTDLKEISSYKDLKGARLDKLIRKFETKYREDILKAFTIYTSDFLPQFEIASEASQSKGGIIGSILLILEFGDTIFSAIKSLFSKDNNSHTSKDMLIGLAMKVVSNKLTKQLTYPTWEATGLPAVANTATKYPELHLEYTQKIRGGMADENYSRAYKAKAQNIPVTKNKSVGMAWYGTTNTIPLTEITKGITVGNISDETGTLKIFSTVEPMATEDKFWVTLHGDQYTQFYYFDEHQQAWQDPFGKGIIVGTTTRNPTETISVNIPSETSYFEITDTTEQEQFLIIVSDSEISEELKHSIATQNSVGVTFLRALEENFPIEYPVLGQHSNLELPSNVTGAAPSLYAVYITIDKSNEK